MAIATKALALDETLQEVVTELQRITGVSVVASLNDLSDADISSTSDGQVLRYNSSAQKWKNEYPHTYSTTEQVVATWINGKPVYEKTFQTNCSAPNISNSLLSDLSIDDVIDLYLMIFESSEFKKYNIGYNRLTAKLTNYPSGSLWTRFLFVRYTKTTDTV